MLGHLQGVLDAMLNIQVEFLAEVCEVGYLRLFGNHGHTESLLQSASLRCRCHVAYSDSSPITSLSNILQAPMLTMQSPDSSIAYKPDQGLGAPACVTLRRCKSKLEQLDRNAWPSKTNMHPCFRHLHDIAPGGGTAFCQPSCGLELNVSLTAFCGCIL